MTARSIRVRGVVQGVGFRPFVFRLARANALTGWVCNQESGVSIHLEGDESRLESFLRDLAEFPPPAAQITAIQVSDTEPAGITEFTIRHTERLAAPTARISPDLPVCGDCLREMRDPRDARYRYAYINCTNCGPRYSVIQRLPYDRANTTMSRWPMDARCSAQYADPADRRFHAQPLACPECGPNYRLSEWSGWEAIQKAAERLRRGEILALKGIGGYHLACDPRNAEAVSQLRDRKFRKDKPFALMARTLDVAREVAALYDASRALLESAARPIVLVPKRLELPGVAPESAEYGLMLPYAPLHHLLFDAGAPDLLVLTSGNRSSEPIAYRDEEARTRLSGIADAFLQGDRPIARRVDDSIARSTPLGPVVLRRSRGYAPAAVAVLPTKRPILAAGADLKNSLTLVVEGQAFVSQHIGDLDDHESRQAFEETAAGLLAMYDVDASQLLIAHDLHPEYFSSSLRIGRASTVAVQHHRAHVASVLAERRAWDRNVVGVTFDGAGYGDDGAIWGGEFFTSSIAEGFTRAMHLRSASLAGGDSAARHPVQASAGFLAQLEGVPDMTLAPFHFPGRYRNAMELVRKGVRVFPTTSIGRLFDTVAALLGFTREITFEGQAAMWLEHLAASAPTVDAYPFPVDGDELDFRPLLAAVIGDRLRGRDACAIARAFHRALGRAISQAADRLAQTTGADTLVLSGGVFQNQLLLYDAIAATSLSVWINHAVPPNDGGISLGQAAIAAFQEPSRA